MIKLTAQALQVAKLVILPHVYVANYLITILIPIVTVRQRALVILASAIKTLKHVLPRVAMVTKLQEMNACLSAL